MLQHPALDCGHLGARRERAAERLHRTRCWRFPVRWTERIIKALDQTLHGLGVDASELLHQLCVRGHSFERSTHLGLGRDGHEALPHGKRIHLGAEERLHASHLVLECLKTALGGLAHQARQRRVRDVVGRPLRDAQVAQAGLEARLALAVHERHAGCMHGGVLLHRLTPRPLSTNPKTCGSDH